MSQHVTPIPSNAHDAEAPPMAYRLLYVEGTSKITEPFERSGDALKRALSFVHRHDIEDMQIVDANGSVFMDELDIRRGSDGLQ